MSPVKDQICLAREKIMEYVERIAFHTAFVDNLTAFAIFLVVSSPLERNTFLLKDSIDQVLASCVPNLVSV